MGFIDVFNFKKYFKSTGDGVNAKIGHVNALAEQLSYTETIVNISSAQILTMGTNPIVLLPNLTNPNQYYDIDKIIIESYTGPSSNFYYLPNGDLFSIYVSGAPKNLDTNSIGSGWGNNKGVIVIRDLGNPAAAYSNFDDDYSRYGSQASLDNSLTLSTYNGGNPAGSDGTLRVKIYHKTITFGA